MRRRRLHATNNDPKRTQETSGTTNRQDSTDAPAMVVSIEDAGRIARRVLGAAHPITKGIERELQWSRAALAARETPGES